ncbi:MAG: aspartate aminotransferase family protein [Chitinophagaceae bacterium]|nr:aspartate aminotransferase family protein [Chitinophagaceae bacterium]
MAGISNRQMFLQHVAQTSGAPMSIEVQKAGGVILTDVSGKEYIDLVAGISVCNVGHCHPAVVKAVHGQAEKYMHVMVYGEFVESPQVSYAKLLSDHLPSTLNTVYFTNSGAEATEGAMKLAKRFTNRTNIISFNKSYHGSTQGALSLIGDEYWRNAYRPLLPGVMHFDYGSDKVFNEINENTACVFVEPVQAESGVIVPPEGWLQNLRRRCNERGALLVFDEIQTGFGRTGNLWAFEKNKIVPDMLLLGKALGGGMPLGAFIADRKIMQALTINPVLGHITTFGGHPVSCAAGKAAFEVLLNEKLAEQAVVKGRFLLDQLKHAAIKTIRSAGLWMAIEFSDFNFNKKVIDHCIANGLITDWFLFAPQCLRIGPPLIISAEQLSTAAKIILNAIDSAVADSHGGS